MGENNIEQTPVYEEYNPIEGVDKAMGKIEELLKTQEYVAIGVCGSSNDVGKTYVSSLLGKKIISEHIALDTSPDTDSFHAPNFITNHRREKPGYVYLFTALQSPAAEVMKEYQDRIVREGSEATGIPLSKIDLRIYVYRPDKPFPEWELPFADIIIRNEEAMNKKKF